MCLSLVSKGLDNTVEFLLGIQLRLRCVLRIPARPFSFGPDFVLAFALRFPGYHSPVFVTTIPRVSIPWCHHKFRNLRVKKFEGNKRGERRGGPQKVPKTTLVSLSTRKPM